MKILHWKMLEVLAQEVAEKRWAYVEQAPYPAVRTGNEYLYILLDIFATEDPRFWKMGLCRCPEKGTFSYKKEGAIYYGEVAARVFLDIGETRMRPGPSVGSLKWQNLLYQDQPCQHKGCEWLKTLVKRLGGDEVDVTEVMSVIPYTPKEGFSSEQRQ